MGNVKIFYGIMHVPDAEREASFQQLQKDLEDYDFAVALDEGRVGRWFACRTLLEHFLKEAKGYTHVCILPDDVTLCYKFHETLHRAVSALKNEIVSVYSNSPAATSALQYGKAWVTRYGDVSEPFVLSRKDAKELLKFKDLGVDIKNGAGSDAFLNLFCLANERLTWTTAVSLVEYVGGKRAAIPPFADMTKVDYKTDAVFAAPESQDFHSLGLFPRQYLEKYPIHKLMFKYERMANGKG